MTSIIAKHYCIMFNCLKPIAWPKLLTIYNYWLSNRLQISIENKFQGQSASAVFAV